MGNEAVAKAMPKRETGTLIKFLAKESIVMLPTAKVEAIAVNAQKISCSAGWPNIFGIINTTILRKL